MSTAAAWDLIDRARREVEEPDDAYEVADRLRELLSEGPRERVVEVDAGIRELLARSATGRLWAAAYLVNGGASDDGFDYFRGWLLTQGREVYERAVADPDSLADVAAVQDAVEEGEELECEDVLGAGWHAHRALTGSDLPPGTAFPLPAPDGTDLDRFDDDDYLAALLPRLAALVEAADDEDDDEDDDEED